MPDDIKKSWWEREQERQQQTPSTYKTPPEMEAFMKRIYGKKEEKPISPEGGQSTLAQVAAGGGSQFADIAAPFTNTVPSGSLDASGLRMAAFRPQKQSLSGLPLKEDQGLNDDLRKQADTKEAEARAQNPYGVELTNELSKGVPPQLQPQTDTTPEGSSARIYMAQQALDMSAPMKTMTQGQLADEEMQHPLSFLTGAIRKAIGGTDVGRSIMGVVDIAGNPFNIRQGPMTEAEHIADRPSELTQQIGGGIKALEEIGLSAGALKALGLATSAENIFTTQALVNEGPNIPEDPLGSAEKILLSRGVGKVFEPASEFLGGGTAGRIASSSGIMAAQPFAEGAIQGKLPEKKDIGTSAAVGAGFAIMPHARQQGGEYETNFNRLVEALVGKESGGDPNAVSPTGVRGKYQMTEANTNQWTEKFLGKRVPRSELVGTPEEDIVGRGQIKEYFDQALKENGGDYEKAVNKVGHLWYGDVKHSVGPTPSRYARDLVNRYRTATGVNAPGSNSPLASKESDNGLSLTPQISEGSGEAPVAAGDEVSFPNGKKATVSSVAGTGEVQLSTGEYATPDDFAQGKVKNLTQKKAEVDSGAHEAATSPTNDSPEPTPLQQQTGNYKKGHVEVAGFDISVENPAGSVRKGTEADGTPWETEVRDHYGYIKGSSGADGDHVDAFIGPDPTSEKVFVVDQNTLSAEDKPGEFDEHKVILGVHSPEEAKEIYTRNYSDDASGRIGAITETTPDTLQTWITEGDPRKPFADYANTESPSAETGGVPAADVGESGRTETETQAPQTEIQSERPEVEESQPYSGSKEKISPSQKQRNTTPEKVSRFLREKFNLTKEQADQAAVAATTPDAKAMALSEPPGSVEEAALQHIASGGRFRLSDVRRDIIGQAKIGGTKGDYPMSFYQVANNAGVSIDSFVHEVAPQMMGMEDVNVNHYDALDARNKVHDIISSVHSQAQAIEQLTKYRNQSENARIRSAHEQTEELSPETSASAQDFFTKDDAHPTIDLPPETNDLMEKYIDDKGNLDHERLASDLQKAHGDSWDPDEQLLDKYRNEIHQAIETEAGRNKEAVPETPDTVGAREKPFYEEEGQVAPAGALRSEIIPGLADAAAEAQKGITAASKINERISSEREASEKTPEEAAKKIDFTAPPEAEKSQIGIANAQIDAMREKYGLPPRMEAIRISHPDAYKQAMERIESNPNEGHDLVDALHTKPRTTEGWENVLLVRERAFREAAVEEASSDLNAAVKNGNEWEQTEAKTRHIEALDRLRKLADVVDRVGTLSGQSLEARKILLDSDDLSLAQMERQYQASVKGGEELTPEESANIKTKFDELQEAKKGIDSVQESHANKEASHYVDKLVRETERLKEENEKLRNASGEIFDKLRSGEIKPKLYGEQLKARGSEFLERGRQRLRDIAAGKIPLSASVSPIHPELLKAYTEIGVGHILESTGKFAEWSHKMIGDIGEKIRPYLRSVYEDAVGAAKKEVFAEDGKRTPAGVLSDIRTKQSFTKNDIFVLAREHAEAGVRGLDILSNVHEQIKSILPATTLRNVRDVFVDYGKVRYPSSDQILKELRRVRSLGQLTSKVEDANKGLAPRRSGIQRDKPDVEVRDLMKKLSAALRDNNIEVGNPEKEIASKHEARMTRLHNEIEDIEHQLSTGERPPVKKPPVDWTPQEKELQSKLDGLREERNQLFAQSKEEIDKARLESAKAAIAKRETDLRQKFKDGDFSRRAKAEPVKPDSELLSAQARFKRLKDAWSRELARGEQANQPKWKRVLNSISNLRRAGVLSSVTVFEKLAAAATTSQFISAPLEEISSSFWRHVPGVSQIAEGAPRWGSGFSMKAEAAGASGFIKGVQDGFKMMMSTIGSESQMDAAKPDYSALYGKTPLLESKIVKRIALAHAAIKEPAKQAEFMRSLVKRLDYAVRNGENVNDPVVFDGLQREANEDAERRIWMNDNALSTAWRNAIHSLESSKKSPSVGPITATLMKMEVPITKVPTNIVADVFNTVAGVPVGIARVGLALAKGVENLRTEQKESIMRQLSKGTPAAAMMLLGLYYHQDIGGFFIRGDKKKKKEVDFGEVRIGDVTLPKELFHTTLGMTLHLGATIGHAVDMQKTKDKNIPEAIVAGTIGLSQNVPFFQVVSNLGKAVQESKGLIKYTGEELKGWVEPSVVQWMARKLDTDSKGQTMKRHPQSWKEIFEEGLPYLRQLVPSHKH